MKFTVVSVTMAYFPINILESRNIKTYIKHAYKHTPKYFQIMCTEKEERRKRRQKGKRPGAVYFRAWLP